MKLAYSILQPTGLSLLICGKFSRLQHSTANLYFFSNKNRSSFPVTISNNADMVTYVRSQNIAEWTAIDCDIKTLKQI